MMRIVALLLLLIIQPWLPQTLAAPIQSSLPKVAASEVTLSPTMVTPSPVPVNECGLQHATGSAGCAVEDSSSDSRLLNASNIHYTPKGLPDTANTQHLQSSTSSSTVNYAMISAIFGGLGLFLALVWSPFAKSYWDKVQNTNTSSNPAPSSPAPSNPAPSSPAPSSPAPSSPAPSSPASSNSELELSSSGSQAD